MKSRKSNAFNLIESAIVLGIVGLVISGIWIAASSLFFNYRASKTAEGILYFKERGTETITEKMRTGTDYSITVFAREARLLPRDWPIKSGSCPTGSFCITNPFGRSAEVRLSNPGVFRIIMNMHPKECIAVVSKVTAGATSASGIDRQLGREWHHCISNNTGSNNSHVSWLLE